jgi:hypothetical protein
VSERATNEGRRAGADPCGIRQAVTGVLGEPWPEFFSQWCDATALGPVAARHVRDVAAQLARPVAPDGGDDALARGWTAVRHAMEGSVGTGVPPLEATA